MKAIILFLCLYLSTETYVEINEEYNHCVPVEHIQQHQEFKVVKTEKGIASWYGFENKVACDGKRIDHIKPALAHRTLPIGTKVRITCTKTKKSVIATVVDRGPYIKGRIVDLNIPAAKQLNILNKGVTTVLVEILKPDSLTTS